MLQRRDLYGRQRSRMGCGLTLVGFLSLVVSACTTVGTRTWQGRVVEQDSLLIVENPREPMDPPRVVELEELWCLGGDTEDDAEFFGVIVKLLVDESGNIYLLDQALNEIKVLSPEGEFVRSIGRYDHVRQIAELNPDGTIQTVFAENSRGFDFANPVIHERVWDDFENRWDVGPSIPASARVKRSPATEPSMSPSCATCPARNPTSRSRTIRSCRSTVETMAGSGC